MSREPNPLEPSGHVPGDFQGRIPSNEKCRAWNPDSGTYCERPAGEGTDHEGEGRCGLHNGSVGPDVAEAGGGAPLSLSDELVVARRILRRRLEALGEEGEVTRKDVDTLVRLLREIRSLASVERGRKESSGSDGATGEELAELGRVVSRAVKGGGEPAEVLERIRRGWKTVRVREDEER